MKTLIIKINSVINSQYKTTLKDFESPWIDSNNFNLELSCRYDESNFYFHFMVNEKVITPEPDKKDRKLVLKSDRVELFFINQVDNKTYYCLEMDSAGRLYDYRAQFHHLFDLEWRWPDNLNLKTKLTENNYEVSGSIKLSTLKELGILHNNKMKVGIYRGKLLDLDNEQDFEWLTWVDPKTNPPDFHVPQSFGLIHLK